MPSELPLVSVIIPTRNSSKTIKDCLISIQKQTYSNIQILVIDSFSTDQTVEIASSLGVRIDYVKGERTLAKNYGTNIATGKYVMYIDSDMSLEPAVIEQSVDQCERNHKRGIVIPERSIGRSFWIKVRDFERSLYSNTIIESPRFFLRSDVIASGGFDEQVIIYEEATLPFKLEQLGLDVRCRISTHILHNEEGFSLKRWLSKKRYYSDTQDVYLQRYERYSKLQLSATFRVLLFTRQWKIMLHNPDLSIGLVVLKTLEYIWSRKI